MSVRAETGDSGSVASWRLKVLEDGVGTLRLWQQTTIEKITRSSTKIEELEDLGKTMLHEVQSLRRTVMGLAISIATGSLAVCFTLVFAR